jgi:hypothetical protein
VPTSAFQSGTAAGVRRVQLEAVLAGVAGAAHDHVVAGNGSLGEVVVADAAEVDVSERLEDLGGLRTLHGEERHVVARVREGHGESRGVPRDVGEVLRGIAGVDDHHDAVGEAIDEAVVLDRAAIVEDRGVVHLADGEGGDVVRGHVIHELHGAVARDPELAMCETSKIPASLADRLVLGGDARGILDGHLVAGEGNDLAAQRDVDLVERGALEGVAEVSVISLCFAGSGGTVNMRRWHGHIPG